MDEKTNFAGLNLDLPGEDINFNSDEFKKIWGNSEFRFIQSGSKFRWEIMQIAFKAQSTTFSIERLINDSETLIKWVNQ